jgi:MoxR-like ATPase
MGLPFYSWSVRSTSKAQDGLFQYDALLRLHDVQMQHSARQDPVADSDIGNPKEKSIAPRDPSDPGFYYTLGPLGRAFDLKECPGVVLIDEIDKADLDFPNDLLAVLDEPWSFTLPENQKEVAASYIPLVIITSNKEKGNLPFPFLRRCLYHFVEFPSPAILKEIIHKHYEGKQPPPDSLIEGAINKFQQLREGGNLHKKPGTSEFLDWVKTLHQFDSGMDVEKQLREEFAKAPYPEVLFKLRADWPRATATR